VFSSADAKFVVLAFSSLFSVINPIEAAPIFVAMTRGMEARRRALAIRASLAAALILAVFALTGGAIFAFFGITLPAFQIAGGILFTSLGLSTLREDDHAEEPLHAARGRPRRGARRRRRGEADAGPLDRPARHAADRGPGRDLDRHGPRRAGA
jgi:small neutral amino acid transporter SnatA (MarC family)